MGSGCSSAFNDHQASIASLDALRGQALKRLAGVEHSLESKGVGVAFARASKADPVGDMGLLGSLVIGMIMGVAIADVLDAHFPPGTALHCEDISVSLDGVALLRDQAAENQRGRKLDDYPEGRRQHAVKAASRMGRKFNLVSANQNNRLSVDAQADMACMYEIIDMLDKLERQGVRAIHLDPGEAVYDALKQVSRKMATGGVLRSCAEPMAMAS